MKILLYCFVVLICSLLFFVSCESRSCEGCVDLNENKPPIANAGLDQTIILPRNTTIINASGSLDPDNNIIAYKWTKISGPFSIKINSPENAEAQISDLQLGVYKFEILVTDAGGLSSRDTMQVLVTPASTTGNVDILCSDAPIIPRTTSTYILAGTLSQPRMDIAVIAAGNKILYAGGRTYNTVSSQVDIYDTKNKTWSTGSLSVGRFSIAAVANGGKVFFAGGITAINSPGEPPKSNVVDIYDLSTNTWSTEHLSIAGSDIAAASVGGKVLFAGGIGSDPGSNRENRIDIYDLSSKTWSTKALSESKEGTHAAITVGTKVYIVGGYNTGIGPLSLIDIYDEATNSWSVSSLKIPRADFGLVSVGNKLYAAGGWFSFGISCSIEVIDVSTGNSTMIGLWNEALWDGNIGLNPVVSGEKIIFSWQNELRIFDTRSNSWTYTTFPNFEWYSSIISVNDEIYLTEFMPNLPTEKVWKMEF